MSHPAYPPGTIVFAPGVNITGVRPELVATLPTISAIYSAEGTYAVITSMNDGKSHSRRSLHYAGAAEDLRTKHLEMEAKGRVYQLIRAALGPHYDVILENVGRTQEHMHIEWQPDRDAIFAEDER